MKKILSVLTFFMVSVTVTPLLAQCDSLQLTLYDEQFQITEGIYYSVHEFRTNSPAVATELSLQNRNMVDDLLLGSLNKDVIIYLDSNELKKVPHNVWGVVIDNELYLEKNGRFHRVQIFGAISHFAKSVPKGIINFRLRKEAIRFNYQQYILDYSTGQIKMYNLTNVSRILQRDPELYREFKNEDNRPESLFRYLLKYNQRHPIYFCTESS